MPNYPRPPILVAHLFLPPPHESAPVLPPQWQRNDKQLVLEFQGPPLLQAEIEP
jgi:hypothetical protein